MKFSKFFLISMLTLTILTIFSCENKPSVPKPDLPKDELRYQVLKEGSRASIVSSEAENDQLPVSGYTAFAPEANGSSVASGIERLSLNVPVNGTFGLVFIELSDPVRFENDTEVALGELTVTLPLYETSYQTLVDLIFVEPGRLQFSFQLTADIPGIIVDPVPVFIDIFFDVNGLTQDEVKALVKKLDDNDWRTREAATEELIINGAPFVEYLEQLLAAGVSPEQRWRLGKILFQLKGVTSKATWIPGGELGQYHFDLDITVPENKENWIDEVYDLHFMVGKPEVSKIDHSNSTINLEGFPENWEATYDEARGEYRIEAKSGPFGGAPQPLKPGDAYKVKITTETMKAGDKTGKMGWYYTDEDHNPVGKSGLVKDGPVFLK